MRAMDKAALEAAIASAKDFIAHPNVHFHYKDGAEVMQVLVDALSALPVGKDEPVAWRYRVSHQQLNWNYWGDPSRPIGRPSGSDIVVAEPLFVSPPSEREVIEACAKIADEHLARIPEHHPDTPMRDLVAQGYGNAAMNIAAALRSLASGGK